MSLESTTQRISEMRAELEAADKASLSGLADEAEELAKLIFDDVSRISPTGVNFTSSRGDKPGVTLKITTPEGFFYKLVLKGKKLMS